jgi:predicted GTPase
MDTEHLRHAIPEIQFRVLIIGRANAGKTSILQRVCDTTESPIIYRGQEKVKLDPSMDRGEHSIDDELVFSNHTGYVFHDSRGIESGSTEELRILRGFIRRKSREVRLRSKLHAIWYCVPMDNQRPQLDLKFYKDICPDRNVPVLVVFTKYDQFLRNVEMQMLDYPIEYPDDNVSDVSERIFQEHYLHPLGDGVTYVRLEKMLRESMRCEDLIAKTAMALNEDVVTLMLIAVQRGNLELSVKRALNCVTSIDVKVKHKDDIVRECLRQFPHIWLFEEEGDTFIEVSGCNGLI